MPASLQPADDADDRAQLPPLPFGPNERCRYHADGVAETATAAELGLEETKTDGNDNEEALPDLFYYVPANNEDDAWQPAIRPDLPLRNDAGDEVSEEAWKIEYDESNANLWSKKISDWASGRIPSYRLGECVPCNGLSSAIGAAPSADPDTVCNFREALPPEDFVRQMCSDARDLVIGCAVHVCSSSCYKYHGQGKNHICRHNFYHIVSFATADYIEVRRRRKGKPLRACLAIIREHKWGMSGRILTYQTHPFECPTNYAALVAMRCNIDVQDLRRTLPPALWMPEEDLEPETIEEQEKYQYMHGAYPQRLKDFSLGSQKHWGWLQHLGTTTEASGVPDGLQDWHRIFAALALLEEPIWDDELNNLIQQCAEAAHMAFVDNHNAGYYINSYTTKLNPTMQNVLKGLLESIRRLNEEWQEAQAANPDCQTDPRQQNFRKTMQVLSRFESSFRRASWKSGCELVFPILFGHLSFTTHRCWTVYMRKSIFLAAEAWRQHYGQLATGRNDNPEAKLDFKLPSSGNIITLEGWRTEVRQGENGDYTIYISPEGEEFENLRYACDVMEQAKCNSADKSTAMHAMRRLLAELKEGHSVEPTDAPFNGVAEAASRAGNAIGYSLSQLDDYLYRGDHTLLKGMSLYIYSMWVYRAERKPFADNACATKAKNPRHIEIPFDERYAAARTWTQRIAQQPRVPKPEGFKFITDADPRDALFVEGHLVSTSLSASLT